MKMLIKQMKSVSLLLALLILALSPGARAEVVDSIAAIVEDRVITRSEVDELLLQTAGPNADPRARAAVLEELIERKLVEVHADRVGVGVSDEELRQEIAAVREANNLDPLDFRAAVESQGMRWEDYESQVRASIRRSKVVRAALSSRFNPSEERLREYYLKHADAFRSVSGVRLLHLMTNKPSGRDQLEELRAKVAQGGDFVLLAGEIGAPPNDTGMVSFEDLAEPIRAAVGDLSPGQVSPLVEIGDSHHLFQLAERDEGRVPPYEEVREKVREHYLSEGGQELFRDWIEQLKEEAYIERRP